MHIHRSPSQILDVLCLHWTQRWVTWTLGNGPRDMAKYYARIRARVCNNQDNLACHLTGLDQLSRSLVGAIRCVLLLTLSTDGSLLTNTIPTHALGLVLWLIRGKMSEYGSLHFLEFWFWHNNLEKRTLSFVTTLQIVFNIIWYRNI